MQSQALSGTSEAKNAEAFGGALSAEFNFGFDVSADTGTGSLVADLTLALSTMADVGDLLRKLQIFTGKYVTSGMSNSAFAKEVLKIAQEGDISGNLPVATSLHASLEVGIRIVFDMASLLKGTGANPFSFHLIKLEAQAGAEFKLGNDTPLFDFGNVALTGSIAAQLGVHGEVKSSNVYAFDIPKLWNEIEWEGSYDAELALQLPVKESFGKFFRGGSAISPLTLHVKNDNIFNTSAKTKVIIDEIAFPSCAEQQVLGSMFTQNLKDFIKAVVQGANQANDGASGAVIDAFGKKLTVQEYIPKMTMQNVELNPSPDIDLKATFDALLSPLKNIASDIIYTFCVYPSLCDGELRLELNISLSKAIPTWTAADVAIDQLPSAVKDSIFKSSNWIPSGTFDATAEFFVTAVLLINNPLGAGTQDTSLPEGEEGKCAGNKTLIELASGVRVGGVIDYSAATSSQPTPFLSGKMALVDAGFDVVFPFGGRAPIADMMSSITTTKVGPLFGVFEGSLKFDPSGIPAIADLSNAIGLDLSKTGAYLTIKDPNVFIDDVLITAVDLDITGLTDLILSVTNKLGSFEFGFDIAGAKLNLPLTVRNLLGDLTSKIQLIRVAALEYFELCAEEGGCSGLGIAGLDVVSAPSITSEAALDFPTLRGLFNYLKGKLMGFAADGVKVSFGNELFTAVLSGGYDFATSELTFSLDIDANFNKEGAFIAKFFGGIENLLARLGKEGTPESSKGRSRVTKFRMFDDIQMYLRTEVKVGILATVSFKDKNPLTDCTLSSFEIAPDTHFDITFGAYQFDKKVQIGSLELELNEAMAEANLKLAINQTVSNYEQKLKVNFCALSSSNQIKSFVSAIPWSPVGDFFLSSKLGASIGGFDVPIKPTIGISHLNVFDASLSTSYTVDFDLNDLQGIKDMIGVVLRRLSAALNGVLDFKLNLGGVEIELRPIFGEVSIPDFGASFDDFFELLKGFLDIKRLVDLELRLNLEATFSITFTTKLFQFMLETPSFYKACFNILKALDFGFLDKLKVDFDVDLELFDVSNIELPTLPSGLPNLKFTGIPKNNFRDLQMKINLIISAFGLGSFPNLAAGLPSIPIEGFDIEGKLIQFEMPEINVRAIINKLKTLRFPGVQDLVFFLTTVAFPKGKLQVGPFQISFSYAERIIEVVICVDWTLSAKPLLEKLRVRELFRMNHTSP